LSDELKQLAKRLYDHCHTAALVERADVAIEGAWKPIANRCHESATTWAANNDGWVAVRGWLVFDYTALALLVPNLPRVVRFNAHSMVQDPDGKLWDITPPGGPVSQDYPFFRHPGTDEEFENLLARYQLVHVDHILD
jgi:hypothetical protein